MSISRNFIKLSPLLFTFLPLSLSTTLSAQSPEDYAENANLIMKPVKRFSVGISIGSYFPNAYTSSLYDGYGFDFDENKNTFENSWMYEKIINQYGGGYGQPDIISEVLGVPPEDWNFDESDMPANMKYKSTFTFGFSGRYAVDRKNAVILNATAAIITATGNFTITTRPSSGSTQVNNSIKQYNISGKEQRLLMQAGYQHLFGKGETFNLIGEGGLHATLAKFEKNEIQIENLVIDLFEPYYDQNGYNYYTGTKPVGLGFGAFVGTGLNINTNGKWLIQMVYDLSLEKVNIGYNPKLTTNHSLLLRAYLGF